MAEGLLLPTSIGRLEVDDFSAEEFRFPDGTECVVANGTDADYRVMVYSRGGVNPISGMPGLLYEAPPHRSEQEFSARLMTDAAMRLVEARRAAGDTQITVPDVLAQFAA